MRPPAQFPRRQRVRNTRRGRTALIVLAILLFVLVTSLRGLARFWTDYLWFESLGYSGVWSGVLGAKIALAAIFTSLFFVLMWLNLFIADRLAPRFRPAGPEEDVLERYHELVGGRTGLVRAGLAFVFALIVGVGASSQWNDWLLFTNRVRFGIDDPQFNRDVGFYVFELPFLDFLVSWLFTAFVVILVVTAGSHYLNGGIRFQTAMQRVTPQVKAHLSVLLGILALIKAADYWLQRFELNFSTRGVVDGAGFTDVKAQLPALNLLILIALFAAALFILNIRRRGWVLPIIAVALWGVVFVVAAGIVPAFIQRFRVEPAESTRERPYIERNIANTRRALNLHEVAESAFRYEENLTSEDLLQNQATIRNVRLLDPNVVLDTYQRLQRIRTFYRFNDLDVDRYELDGQVTQVVIAARDLDPAQVPQQSWEGRHLAYTHGFGVALSPANAVDRSGRPAFRLRDIPPEGTPQLRQPRLYIGEDLDGFAIVNGGRDEIDFQAADDRTRTTRYDGNGGVGMGSLLRRVAFALRFGDINPLISNFVTDDSKVIFQRDIRERVEMLAPFLHFDNDPYSVILEGHPYWVMDAYTTTRRFPYAQRAETNQLEDGSGLDHRFNYVRNSVKVLVDAYHGDVKFYVVDPSDPIIRAWRKAFPELFDDLNDAPEGFQDHLRYPEDLFRVQTAMWGRYHIRQPNEFYEQTDRWSVAQDPGTEVGGGTTTQTTDPNTGELGPAQEERIDPYYLLMRLPREEKEEFLILRPFVPFSENDTNKELSAFMVARSDPEEYGKLQVYVMPRNQQVDGPAIVEANIQSEDDIAREISLLDQRGSQVVQGNLLLIPIEESLIYVRPLYVQAQGATAVPELRKVIVTYGDQVRMEDTLQEALTALGFEEVPETLEEAPTDEDEPAEGEEPATNEERIQELTTRIEQAFAEADAALQDGDLGTFKEKHDEAERLSQELRQLLGPATTTTTTPPDQA